MGDDAEIADIVHNSQYHTLFLAFSQAGITPFSLGEGLGMRPKLIHNPGLDMMIIMMYTTLLSKKVRKNNSGLKATSFQNQKEIAMQEIIERLILLFSPKKRREKRVREQEEALTKCILKSRSLVRWRMVRFAELYGIPVELRSDGFLAYDSFRRLILTLSEKKEDPMTIYEFIFEVGCDFWVDKQWSQVFEAFLDSGFGDDIFSRPGLITELIMLYCYSPELMSPALTKITEQAISVAKEGKWGWSPLVLAVLDAPYQKGAWYKTNPLQA